VAAQLARHNGKRGVSPDVEGYSLGDISVHCNHCYHMAGPNLTTSTRMIIARCGLKLP
jgi:hypothetical protein